MFFKDNWIHGVSGVNNKFYMKIKLKLKKEVIAKLSCEQQKKGFPGAKPEPGRPTHNPQSLMGCSRVFC